MEQRNLAAELNGFVKRAQRVILEYLPQDSGKSKDWLIDELLGILDDRELVEIQRQIEENPALFTNPE